LIIEKIFTFAKILNLQNMKKILFIFIIPMLFIGCSNEYSKTLGDFLQTKKGVKSDLKFELIKYEIVGYVTAADSVRYYQYYCKSRSEIISDSEKILKNYESMAADDSNLLDYAKHTATITKMQSSLEKSHALLNEYNESLTYWSKLDQNTRLMEIVKCTYKIFNPEKNEMQEKTDEFAFSLDGKYCKHYFEIKEGSIF
jgi:hypothetical protein